MKIVRAKLPRGWHYPLKASALEQVIERVGLCTPVTLFLHHSAFWADRPLFHADFHLQGAVLNGEELFWVGCRSVAAEVYGETRKFIETEALPSFASWAAELEALEENSTVRREKQTLVRDWTPKNVR